MPALETERNPIARWHIVKGLGLCHSVRSVPLLLDVCRAPDTDLDHTSLHSIAAWALGRIGTQSYEAVIDLLSEKAEESRRCAVDALGEIRDARAVDSLCEALRHDTPVVGLWAGLALSKLGTSAIECLHSIATNSSGNQRMIALDAIIKIDSTDSLPILCECYKAGTDHERTFLANASTALRTRLQNEGLIH